MRLGQPALACATHSGVTRGLRKRPLNPRAQAIERLEGVRLLDADAPPPASRGAPAGSAASRRSRSPMPPQAFPDLTDREREILDLIAQVTRTMRLPFGWSSARTRCATLSPTSSANCGWPIGYTLSSLPERRGWHEERQHAQEERVLRDDGPCLGAQHPGPSSRSSSAPPAPGAASFPPWPAPLSGCVNRRPLPGPFGRRMRVSHLSPAPSLPRLAPSKRR
jgi:hypothetical protein